MATPSRFDQSSVKGLAEAKRVFKALPADLQARIFDEATSPTGDILLSDAQGRLRPGHGYRTGFLRQMLGVTKSKRTGIVKVGIKRGAMVINVGRSLHGVQRTIVYRPSRIGHLVEFGHGGPRPAQAYPFMIPAAEAQKQPYVQRVRVAIRNEERRLDIGRTL